MLNDVYVLSASSKPFYALFLPTRAGSPQAIYLQISLPAGFLSCLANGKCWSESRNGEVFFPSCWQCVLTWQ